MSQARTYDLIIIGSGAAGGVAAHLAATQGKRVALIEGDRPGGSCPNYACIPTKAMLAAANAYQSAKEAKRYGVRTASVAYNYPSIHAWKERVIAATGVRDAEQVYRHERIDFIQGWAQFVNKNTISVNDYSLKADRFLIATGSHEHLPNVTGLSEVGFLTARQLLEVKSPPKSLAILGGGPVGLEFAELFSSFGTEVTIIESQDHLLPREDHAVGELVGRAFEDRGINVMTGARVLSAELAPRKKKSLSVTKGGEAFTVQAEEILLAAGRSPNTNLNLEAAKVKYSAHGIAVNDQLQTSNHHVYAAGDVVGISLYTHVGTYQAKVALHNMFHRDKLAARYDVIPRSVFTWPEVASVGLTEQQAVASKLKYRAVNVPIAATARSLITGEELGFVKVLARADGRILGASIVSPRASDMIHELALAMHAGLRVQDVATMIHAFPSWSDAIRIACSQF